MIGENILNEVVKMYVPNDISQVWYTSTVTLFPDRFMYTIAVTIDDSPIPVFQFLVLVPEIRTELWEEKVNLTLHIILRICEKTHYILQMELEVQINATFWVGIRPA